MWIVCRLVLMAGLAGCGVAAGLVLRPYWGLAVAVMVFLAIKTRGAWRGGGFAHGTAAFAQMVDLLRARLLGESGIVLGRAYPEMGSGEKWRAVLELFALPLSQSKWACEQLIMRFYGTAKAPLIRIAKFTHVLFCAPTGAGKNVSYVFPILKTLRNCSLFIFDPKGENYRLTADARRAMGDNVYLFDPDGITGVPSDSFNFLDCIPVNDWLPDNCRSAADSIIFRTGMETDVHWSESAVSVLTAILTYVALCIKPSERNLNSVCEIASNQALFNFALGELRKLGGIPARLGSQLERMVDKELAGVMSTTLRNLACFASVPVGRLIEKSSFPPNALLERGNTFYLVLPVDKIDSHKALLRLFLSSFLRYVMQHGAGCSHQNVYVLDECASLAGLDMLKQALILGRGTGNIRLLMFYQAADQVESAFKEQPNLIFDNCDTQVYFGTNSYTTAERISNMLGDATITVKNYQSGDTHSRPEGASRGQGDGRQYSRSSTYSWQEQARRLLQPAEVLQRPLDEVIIFTKGIRPILARRVFYYDKTDAAAIERGSGWKPLLHAWRIALGWLFIGAVAVAGALVLLNQVDRVR